MSFEFSTQISLKEFLNRSYIDKVAREWKINQGGIITVRPEAHNPQIRTILEQIFNENGSYREGDFVIIHSIPAGLEMAIEAADILQKNKMRPQVVLDMRVMKDVVAELSPSEQLLGVTRGYNALTERGRQNRTHWFVPAAKRPTTSSDLYTEAYGDANTLKTLKREGHVQSWDVVFFPTDEYKTLNSLLSLGGEKEWTAESWREDMFTAMKVTFSQAEECALQNPGVQSTIKAAGDSSTLRLQTPTGTDLTYRVQRRPVMLGGTGNVGNISIGETKPSNVILTNRTPGNEVFVAPIEDSVNGAVFCEIPSVAGYGIIKPPFQLYFKDGKIIKVNAEDGGSLRILEDAVGLRPYDRKSMDSGREIAFRQRALIAEIGIPRINPLTNALIAENRLTPQTGARELDEGSAYHVASGDNEEHGGATRSHKGLPLPHYDYLIDTKGEIKITK